LQPFHIAAPLDGEAAKSLLNRCFRRRRETVELLAARGVNTMVSPTLLSLFIAKLATDKLPVAAEVAERVSLSRSERDNGRASRKSAAAARVQARQ
jgi:hypothetical protein